MQSQSAIAQPFGMAILLVLVTQFPPFQKISEISLSVDMLTTLNKNSHIFPTDFHNYVLPTCMWYHCIHSVTHTHTHTHTHTTHSQVLGIVIVFISQVLTVPMNPEMILINQCGSDIDINSSALLSCQSTHNDTVPDIIEDSLPLNQLGPAMIFTPTFTAILFVFYVVFFRPKYKRVAAERVASFEASVYVGNGQNGQTK